jgi:hypothetical protein
MFHRTSPEVAGAVQARLAYLRHRKVVLDDLIRSLERYAVPEPSALQVNEKTKEIRPRLAGVA